MLNRLKWLMICLVVAVSTSAQQINLEQFYNDIIKNEQQQAQFKTTAFDAAPTGNYDIHYHECNWNINPDTLLISGDVTTYLTITQNTASLFFDAADNLIIDSVWVNGINTNFARSTNAIEILFDDELTAGTTVYTTVFYYGSPAATGFGSFVKGSNSVGNVIWTLSEPYGASDWWPCKQTLNDKIDSVDIFVTTPDINKVAGPGLLMSATPIGDQITWHWKSNYPIVNYLIGIVVAPLEIFELKANHPGDSVLFYNMVYPESLEEAIGGVEAIVPIFEIFTDIYGDYPFANEKYGHMQFGWGGGMEHQTMSSVTHFGYDLLVHEMAHQWFGDKITCSSWSDIWLNEGFATYSTWLSYDLTDDPNNYFEAWLTGTRNTIVSKPGGAVWVADTSTVSRIFDGRLTYYKGGWLLHMLRNQLGDEVFFSAIKNYITKADYAYGFVSTEDLIIELENEADTSLAEFFLDWFYGEGFPSYHIMWHQDDNGLVTLAMNQTTSHYTVDFFDMQVPIRLKGAGDSLDITLKHTSSGQLFTIPTEFTVEEIILDPEITLLHTNDVINKSNLLEGTVQLELYPSPADDMLFVQLFELNAADYLISIYNSAAEKVIQSEFSGDANQAYFQVDISALSAGMYVVVVSNGVTDIVKKIIIQ